MPQPRPPNALLVPAPAVEDTGRKATKAITQWDAAVLLASALFLALVIPHPWFSSDAGYLATGAERIVNGQVPFRDFFSELGPGTYYLQAAAFRLLGVNLTAVNVVVWLTALGISWLTYRLSRYVIDGPLAALPSFVFIALFYPINYALSHHWTGNLFFLLALWCLAAGVRHSDSWSPRTLRGLWCAAGVLSAATLFFMQPKGVLAFFLAPAFFLFSETVCNGRTLPEGIRRLWKPTAWFVSGFALVFGALLLLLASGHAANDWFRDNFLFLPNNYWPYQNPPGTFWIGLIRPVLRLRSNPSVTFLLFVIGYYFFMVVGPAAVLFGTARYLRRTRPSGFVTGRLLFLFCLASFAAFFSELHSFDLSHFVMGGILLAPVLLSLFQAQFRAHPGHRPALVAVALVTAFFALIGAGWLALYTRTWNTPVETRRGILYVASSDAGDVNQTIGKIQSRVPSGGETFFFAYDARLYFLTGTRNPTRFDYVLPVFHSPAQIAEVERTLADRRPKFIFDFSGGEAALAPVVVIPHPLETFLLSSESPYRLEHEFQYMKVWTLKQ